MSGRRITKSQIVCWTIKLYNKWIWKYIIANITSRLQLKKLSTFWTQKGAVKITRTKGWNWLYVCTERSYWNVLTLGEILDLTQRSRFLCCIQYVLQSNSFKPKMATKCVQHSRILRLCWKFNGDSLTFDLSTTSPSNPPKWWSLHLEDIVILVLSEYVIIRLREQSDFFWQPNK